MSQNQSKYMKTWTDAYAEVRAKTEEQMGPTGVVLELSHEDWEKMQRGAALDELKSLKKGKPTKRHIDKVTRDTEDEYGERMAKLRPSKYKIHKEDADQDMKDAKEKKKRELAKHFADQEAGSSHQHGMPSSASSGGKAKDSTAGRASTQVTTQSSQYGKKH